MTFLTSLRRVGVAGVAVALCALGAPAASADDMSTGKPALKPVKTKPAKGGVTGQWSYEDGTFECSVPYAPVANKVSGFAIGNCRQGVHLHRYAKSAPVSDTGYIFDFGKIYGSFDGCGWIWNGNDRMLNGTDWNECSSVLTRDESTFMERSDGCAGTSTCNGSYVQQPRDCPVYANYRPWSSSNRPTDYMWTVGANSGRLLWRYITKYANTDPYTPGGQYVMVRDHTVGSGQGNWAFVPRSCLSL